MAGEICKLIDKIYETDMTVGSETYVVVTHINNPHSFYVRPMAYERYVHCLHLRAEHFTANELKLGDVVIFKSRKVKPSPYVRGKITCINNDEEEVCYDIFAMDIGDTEKSIRLKKIWKRVYDITVPSLVTHCKLANCAPIGSTWCDEVADSMREFIGPSHNKIKVKNITNVHIVELISGTCPDDIATMLAFANLSTLGYEHTRINRFDSLRFNATVFYSKQSLKVNTVLHVRMQSGIIHERFYVVQVGEYQDYLSERYDFTAKMRAEKAISIDEVKMNAPIAVLDMQYNRFERGLVKEIMPQDNRAGVQLVDWGNIVEEPISKLKTMPDFYLHTPPRAIWCTLEDQSNPIDYSQLSRIGAEFLITIKELADDTSQTPHAVAVTPLH